MHGLVKDPVAYFERKILLFVQVNTAKRLTIIFCRNESVIFVRLVKFSVPPVISKNEGTELLKRF